MSLHGVETANWGTQEHENLHEINSQHKNRPSKKRGFTRSTQFFSGLLGSQESQRSYRFAIEDFIAWYCSEPRLAFNKTVVLRYRLQLEARHLSASTINVRLAAVRRLAYEAADSGLLSPELAASIRRVKGPKKLGVRLGNWLTATQGKALLSVPAASSVRGKRDFAMLALLLGCGLRRSELVHLTIEHLQRREDHWAIHRLGRQRWSCADRSDSSVG